MNYWRHNWGDRTLDAFPEFIISVTFEENGKTTSEFSCQIKKVLNFACTLVLQWDLNNLIHPTRMWSGFINRPYKVWINDDWTLCPNSNTTQDFKRITDKLKNSKHLLSNDFCSQTFEIKPQSFGSISERYAIFWWCIENKQHSSSQE